MKDKKIYDAIIIGGGIAGASIAYTLSKRKLKTLLIERREDVALEASGNPTGLIYPLLTKHKSIEGNFSLRSFRYVLAEINKIQDDSKTRMDPSPLPGVFLLPKSEIERDRYLGAISANAIARDELECIQDPYSRREGFLFKTALAVSPRHLTKTFLDLAKDHTELVFHQNFKSNIHDHQITITTDKDIYHSEYLFLCHANSVCDFPETSWLPIRKVRGQLLWLPISNELKSIPYSYLFGDYLTQDIGHGCVLGASFDEFKLDEEKRDHETFSFLEQASRSLPELKTFFDQLKSSGIENLKTRVSYRSQSQDRRPVFGPLPDERQFSENISKIPGPSTRITPNIQNLKNTYLLGALGSRGLTHSLFASEVIVRDALKEKNLMEEKDYDDFKPARFLLRNWKRGNKEVLQRN